MHSAYKSTKREKFSLSISEDLDSPKSKKSRKGHPDKLELFIMEQVAQSLSEAATFCNFLKTMLKKLNHRYYLEAKHTIMNDLMKLEMLIKKEAYDKKEICFYSF
ncbi:hypothetical protein PUN28_015759 [Cardiocondyla obscurior]|uniref:Uncharacterized protein n=1 Tax=Cardiocondyla obscurior TaxID=286306 RepID=A0AAW2EUM4_9HYME